jgi:isopenicillin N synthase-like dioxygenase
VNVLKVDYRSPDAAELFAKSLRETGFAVLTNHPISYQLITDTFKDWQNFFQTEEKHKYTFDPKVQAGYFPFRTENAKDHQLKDLKEFYHLFPSNPLPSSINERTRQIFSEMTRLASELLVWVEKYTPEEIRKHYSMPLSEMIRDSEQILLRVLHYPPLSGQEEPGAIRAAAHEDINLITLLPAATAPGLQVKDALGNWHDVPCDPGSIVINAGDMLQEASQGYFRSTTHQVVNPQGPESKKPRYSMPLFLHPRPDVRLSTAWTASEYLNQRLREIGLK